MDVINLILNNVQIIGDNIFKKKRVGYEYFIAVEMDKNIIKHEITKKISADENLKLDFDAYQFNKVFEEEMDKFEKR